jgi:hypothetical protein
MKPLRRATCTCSSGLAPMAARGMCTPAVPPLGAGTWQCCSGCVPMAARGIGGCAMKRATRLCCTGLAPMDARRTRTADCDSGARRATAMSRRVARTAIDVSPTFPNLLASLRPRPRLLAARRRAVGTRRDRRAHEKAAGRYSRAWVSSTADGCCGRRTRSYAMREGAGGCSCTGYGDGSLRV